MPDRPVTPEQTIQRLREIADASFEGDKELDTHTLDALIDIAASANELLRTIVALWDALARLAGEPPGE